MLRLIFTLIFSMIATACGPRYIDYFPYYDDGAAKPAVAFIPIIDSTSNDFSWSLSCALSSAIRYEAMNDGTLYFLSEDVVDQGLGSMGECQFLMEDDQLAKSFCATDFVVIPELIEYSYQPFQLSPNRNQSNAPCSLLVKLRLRIVDVRRTRCPRVLLQEVITRNYQLPANSPSLFGCDGLPPKYGASVVGKIHQRLCRDIMRRVIEVVSGG